MEEKKYKALFVDDDNFLRETYTEALVDSGFEVIEARDGQEGLELAKARKPDIIICGIEMPRMTGFQMIEQLKKSKDFSKTPFFIFSHLGRDRDREKSEELGVTDFLVRAVVSPKEFVRRVHGVLSGKVYRLVIDANQVAGKRLLDDFGCKTGRAELELERELGNERKFKARLICK